MNIFVFMMMMAFTNPLLDLNEANSFKFFHTRMFFLPDLCTTTRLTRQGSRCAPPHATRDPMRVFWGMTLSKVADHWELPKGEAPVWFHGDIIKGGTLPAHPGIVIETGAGEGNAAVLVGKLIVLPSGRWDGA
ncbi:hypothetical protein MLD38_034434 [Melastoma candidum]|uniref:Uncharacterized protein n=1 Tax=Melastoma candidum TaxID=119954 RepID=A0ACB9MA16_9MYRT|nr:hypothetical protein MLD38_034434 [Melastoma candidum]